jgi:dolichol-phosphate mannosyltransferase
MANLSVVIPARDEADNLRVLLPELGQVLSKLDVSSEIIVIDGNSADKTALVAKAHGAKVVPQSTVGYGRALREGFRRARGSHVLTIDADLSHDPSLIETLWLTRHDADVVIASRYMENGSSDANWSRRILSKVLNNLLAGILDLNVTDLSSGYRLYRSSVVQDTRIDRSDFAALVEVLVRAYAEGWRVTEVPFRYQRRKHGQSHAHIVRLGVGFFRTAYHMWRLRNSIACADYDDRAYDSRIPFQRYWQHRRCSTIARLAEGRGTTLDIGCGSSRTLAALKDRVIGLDIQVNKLRYARRYGVPLTNADVFSLPFAAASFDCVVCSEVIEHLPQGSRPFDEIMRVLKPGGRLVLGTPDYGMPVWPVVERIYRLVASGAYGAEHITHYTRASLIDLLESYGIKVQEMVYIFRSEFIIKGTKVSDS